MTKNYIVFKKKSIVEEKILKMIEERERKWADEWQKNETKRSLKKDAKDNQWRTTVRIAEAAASSYVDGIQAWLCAIEIDYDIINCNVQC